MLQSWMPKKAPRLPKTSVATTKKIGTRHVSVARKQCDEAVVAVANLVQAKEDEVPCPMMSCVEEVHELSFTQGRMTSSCPWADSLPQRRAGRHHPCPR
jgi:hypothetical protein